MNELAGLARERSREAGTHIAGNAQGFRLKNDRGRSFTTRMRQRELEHTTERLDESERVFRWRMTCLREIGYSRDAAAALAADTRIDLHAALRLVERGCAPETAVRILE